MIDPISIDRVSHHQRNQREEYRSLKHLHDFLFSEKKMSVTLSVFGLDYPLPVANLPRAKLLNRAFSGTYTENQQNRIELELDPAFKEAFDWIYSRLISDQSWAQNRPFPVGKFADLLQLADYLDSEFILDELRGYIIDGQVPVQTIIDLAPIWMNIPLLKNTALFVVVRDSWFYDSLPSWAQEYFNLQQNRELPTDGFVMTKVTPVTQRTQLNYPRDYARECQKPRQPKIVEPYEISNLSDHQNLYRVENHLMTCPNPAYPHIGLRNGLPCCYRQPQLNTSQLIPKPVLTDELPYQTPAGFLVFLNPGFQGDYIVSNDFVVYPELNAIVL